jgi:hypothetical protein
MRWSGLLLIVAAGVVWGAAGAELVHLLREVR